MQMEWETAQAYMAHHPRWFETFGRRAPGTEHLRAYRALIPGAWKLGRRGYWLSAAPPGVAAVAQGWKLHVSASSETSEATLRAALPVLRDAGVHFKFLMDPDAVRECNGKSFSRSSSCKFITVYPSDEAEFRAVGDALARALDGFDGPYILSDRRYPGSRVVFYRYGGFAAISRMQPVGAAELLIHDPDGNPVPDVRHPYFHTPPWVRDPFEPVAAGVAQDATSEVTPDAAPDAAPDAVPDDTAGQESTLAGGRFTVTTALTFSNRGGIYRATDNETGAEVIIREARPGVQIGTGGLDAVDLLAHEYAMLTELADTGLFVRPVAYFTEWEHAFIAEEFIEGTHFGHLSITQNPLYSLDLSAERLSAYYERFRGLWLQIADAIAACHERGIVLGDLSPTNIMVTDDDQVRIIDMESAFREDAPPGDSGGAGLFTPGLVTRRARRAGRGDRRTDYYALGALLLVTVMVCHQSDILDPGMPRRMLAELATDLDLPAELVALIGDLYQEDAELPDPARLRARIEAVDFAGQWRQPPPLARPVSPVLTDAAAGGPLRKRVDSVLDGVTAYMTATADLTREDRLFPADAMVFQTNPLSLAHGAYGVLYTLHRLGAEVPDSLLGWALSRPTGPRAMPPGLYYGTAGVAWAQSALGHTGTAVRTLEEAGGHPLRFAEPGMLTGAAGYGMACLRLWRDTGRDAFAEQAREAAAHLAATARRETPDAGTAPFGLASWELRGGRRPVGYGEGASGPAVFLLALHAATGDRLALELGRAALDFDLAQAERHPGGLLSFPAEATSDDDEPSSVLRHYWDEGTAGVLTAALRYARFTGDQALTARIRELLPDVRRKYTVFPQLFHGAAGIGNVLLDAYEFLGDPELLGDAERVAAAVLCTAIERPEGIVFPGEQLVRESCDLATGSAGVALFLDRLRHARPRGRTNANFVLDDIVFGPADRDGEGTG